MKRIIGIDYGDKRVGIAVSDPLGFGAHGVGTFPNNGLNKLVIEINKVIDEYASNIVVIGMPLNMDGTKGFRGEATDKFIEKLKTVFAGEIIAVDERLTTVGASRFLNETNTRGKKRKDVIDTVSACLILESYLSRVKNCCQIGVYIIKYS